MVFEIAYLSKLPIEYRKAVKNLNKKLNGASTFELKNRHLYAFSEKYTILPEIWKYWVQLIQNSGRANNVIPFDLPKLTEKAVKDFSKSHEKEWPALNKSSEIIRLINKPFEERLKEAELLISFPHSKLSLAFKVYQEFQGRKVSKAMMDKYKNVCELYKKIEGINIEDSENLIKLFMETKNNDYVIKNIEHRLFKNPWCQNLWKTYIQHQETKDNRKDVLQVFSRYCRLFVGDKEMKEKYQEKIEKISENCDFNISEFWIDLIKFEFQFNSINSAKALLQKAFEAKMKDSVKFFDEMLEFYEKYHKTDICNLLDVAKRSYLKENPNIDGFNFKQALKQASFDNQMNQQKLPFSKTVSGYILKNISHSHLRHLHQTCKYFYFNYRFNITQKIEFGLNHTRDRNQHFRIHSPYLEYQNYNISISPSYFDWNKIQNIWLTNTLSINSYFGAGILNNFFSKIVKFDIKYLYLYSSHLTMDEFDLLTKSQTIKHFYTYYSSVYVGAHNEISLDNLLNKVPNVRYITFIYCIINPQTFENLLSTKFNNKFKLFDLRWMGDFPQEQLIEFLQKNISPKATLNLYRMGQANAAIKNFMEEKIAAWQPENEKPIYTWSNDQ